MGFGRGALLWLIGVPTDRGVHAPLNGAFGAIGGSPSSHIPQMPFVGQ